MSTAPVEWSSNFSTGNDDSLLQIEDLCNVLQCSEHGAVCCLSCLCHTRLSPEWSGMTDHQQHHIVRAQWLSPGAGIGGGQSSQSNQHCCILLQIIKTTNNNLKNVFITKWDFGINPCQTAVKRSNSSFRLLSLSV